MDPKLTGRISHQDFIDAMCGTDGNKEPLPQDHKLRFFSNALLLPHLGYVTAENYYKFYPQMVENLISCIEKKPIRILVK